MQQSVAYIISDLLNQCSHEPTHRPHRPRHRRCADCPVQLRLARAAGGHPVPDPVLGHGATHHQDQSQTRYRLLCADRWRLFCAHHHQLLGRCGHGAIPQLSAVHGHGRERSGQFLYLGRCEQRHGRTDEPGRWRLHQQGAARAADPYRAKPAQDDPPEQASQPECGCQSGCPGSAPRDLLHRQQQHLLSGDGGGSHGVHQDQGLRGPGKTGP